jgi:hypothetical protein
MQNTPLPPRDSSTPLRSAQNDCYESGLGSARALACWRWRLRHRELFDTDVSYELPFKVNQRVLLNHANLDHRALHTDDR